MSSTLRRRRRSSLVTALYVNAGLLAAVWVAVVSRGRGPGAAAVASPTPGVQPIAGGNGMYLMPGQLSQYTWGCYVMDVDRQTLTAYEYLPGQKSLKLVTARYVAHDRQLQEYNTSPPPDEVKRLVQLQNQGVRGQAGQPNPSADGRQVGGPAEAVPAGKPGVEEPAGGERPFSRPPRPGDADFVPQPSDINNPGR